MEWVQHLPTIVAVVFVLGLLVWLFLRMFTSADEKLKINQVERKIRSTQFQSIYDYDLLIAEIQEIRDKCSSYGYATKMLNLKIKGLVIDKVRAERYGYPYATPQQRAEAEKILGVDDTVNLQALGRAHKRALEPYDPDMLKKRNAPAKVQRAAAARRAEIRRAYIVLKKCITK